jgi:two-component system, OmpR family, alkaline phosphatase synthesis response regulator PhoP
MERLPKLLVIDDQPFIVAIFSEILNPDEVELISATNGEDGFILACQQKPDLIFLDIEMPRLDGLSVCRKLRQQTDFQDTPIYMLSARGETPSDEEQAELRISGYLTKPFSPSKLFNLIKLHLQLSSDF